MNRGYWGTSHLLQCSGWARKCDFRQLELQRPEVMWSICLNTSDLSSSPPQCRKRSEMLNRSVQKCDETQQMKWDATHFTVPTNWHICGNKLFPRTLVWKLSSVFPQILAPNGSRKNGRKWGTEGKAERFCCSSNLQLLLQLYVGKQTSRASLWYPGYPKMWLIASFVKQARSPEKNLCAALLCLCRKLAVISGKEKKVSAKSKRLVCQVSSKIVKRYPSSKKPVNNQDKEEQEKHHKQKYFEKVFMFCFTVDPFRKGSLRASQYLSDGNNTSQVTGWKAEGGDEWSLGTEVPVLAVTSVIMLFLDLK